MLYCKGAGEQSIRTFRILFKGGGGGGGINRADTLYIPPQLSCMIYMYVHMAASLLPIFNVIFLFLFFFISSDSIVFARLNKEGEIPHCSCHSLACTCVHNITCSKAK